LLESAFNFKVFRFYTQPRSAIRLPSDSDTVETETPPCFVL